MHHTGGGKGSSLSAYIGSQWDAALTWDDVDWLRSISPLPVVVKGVLAPADADLSVQHGAAAVIVSNHGARQLDTAPASITMLEPIVAAVDGRAEVLIDGGIRRGTDVLKALCLGARAVRIGRPILWGLAIDGEEGVRSVLRHIRGELDLAMALAGVPSLDAATRDLVLPHRSAEAITTSLMPPESPRRFATTQ
jgi:isopentenyl diphosphate isomerase/L-lactate dehydrogenase-like FMN-dependent dehydrogenase